MAEILQYIKPYNLRRLSGSITEPLSLVVVKNYLKVDFTNDDTLIAEMIVAVRQFAENHMNLSLAAQSFEAIYENELPNFIVLPMSPIASIISVIAEDLNGVQTNFLSNMYRLAAERYLHFYQYVAGERIYVRYQTSNNLGLQADIKRAMLSHIALMYDERGDAPIPADSLRIYNQYKMVRV
jgi:uncharacterized phiE125 gp8 family phage protein